MKRLPTRHRCPSLGFRWSPKDELRMSRARKAAALFMEHFGRGSAAYMVDLRHYINAVADDSSENKPISRQNDNV